MRLTDRALYRAARRNFRARRMQALATHFRLTPDSTVHDVGGTPENWQWCPVRPRVVLLVRDAAPRFRVPDHMTYVAGDACRLPYADGAFDLVYSNSVIEHVGNLARQQAFAREVQRVGRAYAVQTPALGFPVEPHLWGVNPGRVGAPMRRALARWGSLWGWMEWPSSEAVAAFVAEVRLLSRRELRALFPEARIVGERVGPLVRSWLVTHYAPQSSADARARSRHFPDGAT